MQNQNENNQPLTTQGNAAEQEENMGGTTNVSLDQLKQEGGIADFFEGVPEQESNTDDLNEIRAADDLNEPDPEDDDLDATGADEVDLDDEDDLDDQDTEDLEQSGTMDSDLDDEAAENPENNS